MKYFFCLLKILVHASSQLNKNKDIAISQLIKPKDDKMPEGRN